MIAPISRELVGLNARRGLGRLRHGPSSGRSTSTCASSAEKAGGTSADERQIVPRGFGVVQGEDGNGSRLGVGETVRLVDLLDESVTRMEKSLKDGWPRENVRRLRRGQVRG